METDFVKAMEINTQTTTVDGIMNTLVKDIREGEKEITLSVMSLPRVPRPIFIIRLSCCEVNLTA